eukprot:3137918-Prymnesium_polylepis.1
MSYCEQCTIWPKKRALFTARPIHTHVNPPKIGNRRAILSFSAPGPAARGGTARMRMISAINR